MNPRRTHAEEKGFTLDFAATLGTHTHNKEGPWDDVVHVDNDTRYVALATGLPRQAQRDYDGILAQAAQPAQRQLFPAAQTPQRAAPAAAAPAPPRHPKFVTLDPRRADAVWGIQIRIGARYIGRSDELVTLLRP